MPIDMNALRLEVAKRHSLLLSPTDPIFAAVTLNELVLASVLERAENTSAEWERRGAALMAQEIANVKAIAEKMILGAATFFATEVKKSCSSAENSMVTTLEQRIKTALTAVERAEAAKRPALWAAVCSIAAALVTLGVVIGTHWK